MKSCWRCYFVLHLLQPLTAKMRGSWMQMIRLQPKKHLLHYRRLLPEPPSGYPKHCHRAGHVSSVKQRPPPED
uniref:Putative secreted protein n=1 Tax=Anopheles triannulatus TaxID=58253 RepID=A0A2M4B4V8_9DIPT